MNGQTTDEHMNSYTEYLDTEAQTISPEDDDYEEKLLSVATQFRGFDEALTDFIKDHGYAGDPAGIATTESDTACPPPYRGGPADIAAKAQFLREKFKSAGIKPPRDFKEWFVPGRKISRRTAFQICFAFGLDVDETNEFFRCVQFERGFDCHTVSEAVYYFCFKNGLSYPDAQEIIARIPVSQKAESIPDEKILYTTDITRHIDSFSNKDQLISYITANIGDFRYNNVTAIGYIKEFWSKIAEEGGLAYQEGALIDRTINRFEDKHRKGGLNTRSASAEAAEIRRQEHTVKPEDHVVAEGKASTWIILSQMIGLRNYQESEYSLKHDRSLTSVLSENKLMPLRADYCFPNRQNIEKLVRGELVGDDEIVRKILILLVFYTHWAELAISKGDIFYTVLFSDSDRCLDIINNRLLSAGYPSLYAGNPYDWLFLWALNADHPLDAFRSYMGEVFAVKEEQEANV